MVVALSYPASGGASSAPRATRVSYQRLEGLTLEWIPSVSVF